MNQLGLLIQHYLVLSGVIFTIGAIGFLVRRNVLIQLMSIELMLNSVNLLLVAFNRQHGGEMTGQMFAFFIIAVAAADTAKEVFGRDPRVGFVSYSDFGSAGGEEPERVRQAVEMFRKSRPDVPADGEMQADTAVVPELLRSRRPDGPLERLPNVLVFPNLTADNASYKLLNRLAGAEVIGPILTGLAGTVHVLQRDASVSDVVNMTAIAVAEAQRRDRAARV